MADINKTIKVDANITDAQQDLGTLTGQIDNLDTGVTEVTQSTGDFSKANKLSADEVTKNGGAIAILDSLTGGMATKFRDASEATRLFNFSLKGMRTALIATGIGALVVAVGLLVAYWDDIKDYVNGVNRSLEYQLELSEDIVDRYDSQFDILESQREQLELQGESGKNILKYQKQILLDKLSELELQLKINASKLQEAQLEAKKLSRWQRFKGIFVGVEGMSGITVKEQKELNELEKEFYNSLKDVEKIKTRILKIDKTIEEKPKTKTKTKTKEDKEILDDDDVVQADEVLKQIEKLQDEYFFSLLEKQTQEEEAVQDKYRNLIEMGELYGEDTAILEEAREFELKEIRDRYRDEEEAARKEAIQKAKDDKDKAADEDKARDDKRKKEKEELWTEISEVTTNSLDVIANALDAASLFVEEGSQKQKNIAIAVAVIDTLSSAVKAYNSVAGVPVVGPVLGGIAAATALAAGYANVKKIKEVKIGTQSDKSVPMPSVSAPAPQAQFNIVGTSGTNQLAETLAQTQEQPPIKAYVVSSDVSTAQSLDRNRIDNSTFL